LSRNQASEPSRLIRSPSCFAWSARIIPRPAVQVSRRQKSSAYQPAATRAGADQKRTGHRVGLVTATRMLKRKGPLRMQYRIQFCEGSANVIRELSADVRSAASAFELVADIDWPPRAVSIRVLDVDGREVHTATRGDVRR
jgi:hypothetical protein